MVKIGLEIHGYLKTKNKLFCNCKSDHGIKNSLPNTNICPTCTGQPGSKPMLPNKEAIEQAIKIAFILNCKVNKKMKWQRKHYSWPDNPKGYQNTLSGPHATPIGVNGNFKGINITECHLEEDPAAWNPKTGEIDYNRSGAPLIEIVTEPDFKEVEEVTEWLKKLKETLNYFKTIDKSTGMKVDVNISLPELNGSRIEIKNINSIEKIRKALEYEIERQKKDVPKAKETRAFDEASNKTKKMRSKENTEDYRFISDPDLPEITLTKERVDEIKGQLPEGPEVKIKKLAKEHKLNDDVLNILVKNLDFVEMFEESVKKVKPLTAINWITKELQSVLNYNKKTFEEVDIETKHLIELMEMVEGKKITELKGKEIIRKFIPKSFSPNKEEDSNKVITSDSEIRKICQEVIEKNKNAVSDYKSGKLESLNFLMGQVMKLSNKRADFNKSREILKKELE